jgi:hypothetical protein
VAMELLLLLSVILRRDPGLLSRGSLEG